MTLGSLVPLPVIYFAEREMEWREQNAQIYMPMEKNVGIQVHCINRMLCEKRGIWCFQHMLPKGKKNHTFS